MANKPLEAQSSAQQGFLAPGPGLFRFQFDVQGLGLDEGYSEGVRPLEGQTLDKFMQQLVAGITQLKPNLVFPRWQPEPPVLPQANINWASVGVTDQTLLNGWPVIMHDPANEGRDILEQWEEFNLMCSFYGPDADSYDAALRDGLMLPQNREILQINSMGLISHRNKIVVPELMKNTWLRRVDRQIKFTRAVLRSYPVLNLLGISVQVNAESDSGYDLLTENVIIE